MKKLLLLCLILILTGCQSSSILGKKTPEHLKLKTTEDKILHFKRIKVPENIWFDEDGKIVESVNKKDMIQYHYVSDEEVEDLPDEIVKNRTERSREIATGVKGKKKKIFYMGKPFYKENNGSWKKMKIASTTPEAFDEQITDVPPAILDYFIKEVRAFDVSEETGLGTDDCYKSCGGNYNDTSTYTWLSSAYRSGWRFQTVNIPNGVTIEDATLTLQLEYNSTLSGTAVHNIFGEDVDDASNTFSNGDDPCTRTATSNSTAWSIVDGSAGDTIVSPNIGDGASSPVGEVLGRGGWAANNDLVLFSVYASGDTSNTYPSSYESARTAPTLDITYAVATPTEDEPQGVPAIILIN